MKNQPMKDQEQLTQEICDEVCHAVENDERVVAARKKVEKADRKALKAWIGMIISKTGSSETGLPGMGAASLEYAIQEILPLEAELFCLKESHLRLMQSVFEENKASHGLPEDVKFFDCFLHPLDDQELMRMIVGLITFYQEVLTYRKEIKKTAKKMAKKMKGAGVKSFKLNGQEVMVADVRQDLFLAEEEKLKIAFAAHFVGIERIKISIECASLRCRDIGKRFLNLLKTLRPTKITKELTAYFEAFECLETGLPGTGSPETDPSGNEPNSSGKGKGANV